MTEFPSNSAKLLKVFLKVFAEFFAKLDRRHQPFDGMDLEASHLEPGQVFKLFEGGSPDIISPALLIQ